MSDSIEKTNFEAGIVTEPHIKGVGLNSLKLLANPKWLQQTLKFIWIFKKHTYKPALLFAIGEICAVLSLFLSMQDLVSIGISGEPIDGLGELSAIMIKAILIIIVFGGASLILVTWSVGLWIVTLTGFCRSYLTDFKRQVVSEDKLFEYQKSCINHFKTKKTFLFVVWIIYSIIMIVPASAFLVAFLFIYMSMPGILPYPIPFSPDHMTFWYWLLAISSIVLSNHFLIALPLSSVSSKGGRAVATDSFIMAIKSLPVITVFTLILALVSLVVSVPEFLLLVFNTTKQEPSLYWRQCLFQLIGAGWHAGLSIFVWPISFVLPCELLKNGQKQPDDTTTI